MDILIIEDEPLVAKDIHKQIVHLEPEAKVVGVLSSVESCCQWFGANPVPDLILSDIQLSDGTAFEIFEACDIRCPIIFTTAYNDYAIRAFKLNSIDYLLKPIDNVELAKAYQKYKSLNAGSFINEAIIKLAPKWGAPQIQYKERFLVMQGNSLVPLQQDEISFFHKEQLIFVHNLQNEKFICEFNSLDEVEHLVNPKFFFRVNRQYLLNLHAVGKVRSTHKGLSVVTKFPCSVEIDISREKAVAFKKWLS